MHRGVMRLVRCIGFGVLYVLLWVLTGCQAIPDWRWELAEADLPRQTVILTLAVDPDDPHRLWAGYYAPGGLAISQDGGRTWSTDTQGLGDDPVFDLLSVPGHSLLAATRDGLLERTQEGETWKLKGPNSLPSTAAFALASDASGKIYVGLDDAGVYVGDPEKDTWHPLSRDEPLSTAAVLSLAVSRDGNYLYAGSAGAGLYASQDAGRTWTAAFPLDFVPNLALDPSHPMTAVASLRDRLVRTDDGGRSWHTVSVPWAADEVVSLLWLEGPATRSSPMTGASGTLLAGSGQGQVYCSQDGGESWEKRGARVPSQGGVLALAAADDRLFAGTWTGIYASPLPSISRPRAAEEGCGDPSQAWTYLSPSLGIPNANTLATPDAGLLVGTRAGLFRWQPTTRRWAEIPLSQSPSGGVAALASAPSDGQVVFAGAAGGGLYRSEDSGTNWARVPSNLETGIRALVVAPDDADHVYMLAAWERIYESNDGGQNWKARWTGLGVTTEAISLAIDPANPSTLYVGTDTGLYRSHYGGEDWRPVGRSLDSQTVLTLVAGPAPNAEERTSVLYVGATRGAYRSYDSGDTIEPWGKGLEAVSVTYILFDQDDSWTVYAGTAYHGLYGSVDGGETWQPMGPPELKAEVVESMAWGPAGELFVVSAGGVWMGSKN